MSYTYVSSIALPRASGAQWVYPNLSTQTMSSIFAVYDSVYVVLAHNLLAEQVNVDLSAYRNAYYASNQTLQQWLTDTFGAQTLETVSSLPSGNIRFAHYTHAIPQRYKLSLGTYSGVIPNDYLLGHTDVVMTRSLPYTDMDTIQRHCLVSVNGFIHSTSLRALDNSLFIHEAARGARQCKNNSVGILSFARVGQLTKIPIELANIRPMNVGQPLKDGLLFDVNLPNGFTLDNKSYMLILGGYMVTPVDGSNEPLDPLTAGEFYRTGERTFRLNLNNLPYVERILESNTYLDLHHLGVTQYINNNAVFNINAIQSDETIRKYLTMSQSFLCVINTKVLAVKSITVRNTTAPGNFVVENEPTYPLTVGYGRIAEYTKEFTGQNWVVNIADPYTRNYLFTKSRPPQNGVISNQLVPYQPYTTAHAKFLQISGYTPV